MSIMIPDKPGNVPEGSREDEMFTALSTLPNEYYVFHSFVIISNSDGVQRESETDFIIFHPEKGIICLEAKAGHVYCNNGTWFYGSGIPMKHGGPYRQADSNKWKLQKHFEDRGMYDVWEKCKTLHAVWFPSVSKNELNGIHFPADADRSITLTEESLSNIESDIDRIFRINLTAKTETVLTKREANRILENILCPSFDLVPSMVSELGIKRNAFNRLLKEQVNILNFLDDQPFAVINGPAGSGKTMIAVEKARRHAENGDKVLFLCFNKFLRDFLKKNFARDNVSYYTIDGFACAFCDSETADYKLLQDNLEQSYFAGDFPYKHIIIDEGQDFGQDRIEEMDIIQTLETIVLSDEIQGSFYLFYDKNQLVQGRKIPQYISDSDCKLSLYKNCRNTENIAVTSMRPLKSNSVPKMIQGCVKGESPRIYISESVERDKAFIDKVLMNLAEKRIMDVVILTCETEENSAFSKFVSDGKYICNGTIYRFTTCRKFKGLEADAIILVDVTKKTMKQSESLVFYVGASRARFFLSVVCQMSEDDCEKSLEELDIYDYKRPKKALAAALNALLSI